MQSDNQEAELLPNGKSHSPGDAGLTIPGAGRDQNNEAAGFLRVEQKVCLQPESSYKS